MMELDVSEFEQDLDTMLDSVGLGETAEETARLRAEILAAVNRLVFGGIAAGGWEAEEEVASRVAVLQTGLPTSCRDVLIAYCAVDDLFDEVVRECVYHAGLLCPETKLVLFLTTQWLPALWEGRHAAAFQSLPGEKAIFFVGLGGITWISNPPGFL